MAAAGREEKGTQVMTEIRDEIVVDCSSSEAASHLQRLFESPSAQGPDGAVLTLRVPVGDATLERDVVAKLTPRKAEPGFRTMDLTWGPKGGGPYPVFDGTLVLDGLSATTSKLAVIGRYGPPGGIAGAAFDAVVGKRIATASLKALLEVFKTTIETARTASAASAAQYLATYE